MPDESGTFKPIGHGHQRMVGETALLVSGYGQADQSCLCDLLKTHGLDAIPAVFIDEHRADLDLETLAAERHVSSTDNTSALPRAIIMSGLTERELHALMKAYRESGLPRQVWASVTPVSRHWTLRTLLNELSKEKEELRKAVLAQQAKSKSPAPRGGQ
ncbi:MAG: DUF3783 domain-containing protein [Verrucomicrobia bacterium]|nr:DUF3783 domain-containing protein [Verrucomicrobiota bacterium]